jgi:alkyl hydroperoxide reductase subunit AhpF
MSVLAAADRSAVERLMSGAGRPVQVVVLTGAGGANAEFTEVLEEIRQVAPALSVLQRPWGPEDEALAERAPAVVLLDGDGRSLGVRFSGYPVGYEFGAFVQDLADAAHGRTGLSEATLEALRALKQPARIKVFTTPT